MIIKLRMLIKTFNLSIKRKSEYSVDFSLMNVL